MKPLIHASLAVMGMLSAAALIAGCEKVPTPPSPGSVPKPKTVLQSPHADTVPMPGGIRI